MICVKNPKCSDKYAVSSAFARRPLRSRRNKSFPCSHVLKIIYTKIAGTRYTIVLSIAKRLDILINAETIPVKKPTIDVSSPSA